MKIPTDKDRKRQIRKLGGVDDSYLDKKGWKSLGNTWRCYWCKEFLKPKMFNHRDGSILMGCDTPDCIGNPDTSETLRKKKLRACGARFVDKKLVMDFKDLLYGRDPGRMWAVHDRIW
ncbi:MAG: hypothetical protein ACTSQY_00055 [Candidatus Odinarchaeia archaeon]|nr:MAG: hypothetical protein [Lokiarchaeota virus Fenrir Meg22_1012]URC17190.1 MAG: hypothetical protein [Lokiarchaeota virus Fenrir Meg22_1214]